jgi:hypothetical protein
MIEAVVVWDLDRLTRRPVEIEHFIDLADRKGVMLASVGGDVDLGTDNGRMFARIKGAVARAEVERKSARQRRANEQRAASGLPHAGRRCFGYEADGVTVRDREAQEVQHAVQSLLRGVPVRRITREMNERGATTTAGGPWRPTEVRRMLVNARYAGLRVHRGEQVGVGKWPAIVDPDDHAAVVALLASPERHKAGAPTRHLLSGIARCGVCDGRIFGVTDKVKGTIYFCESRRHVSRKAADIDSLVVDATLVLLSEPHLLAMLAGEDAAVEQSSLRERERLLRTRLDDLAISYAEGEIDRAQLSAASARLRAELRTTSEALAANIRQPVLRDLASSPDVIAAWNSLDMDRRREVIECLASIVIHPAGRGRRSFDPSTVTVTPAKGPE